MSSIIQGGLSERSPSQDIEDREKWATTCKVWKKWIKPLLKTTGELIEVDFKTKQVLGKSTIVEKHFSFDLQGRVATIRETHGMFSLYLEEESFDEKGKVFLEFKQVSDKDEWVARGLMLPLKHMFNIQNQRLLQLKDISDILQELGSTVPFTLE